MAIPRASIPQANIQQAQPLLAQFNAARAAAQGQPMPVIQGRGLDPAQLMQMAQGNALQVSNTLNGQANQFIATDPAVDIRARERYLEGLEKDTQSANRADSRAVFNANRNDARTIYSTEKAQEAAELLAQQKIESARLQHEQSEARLDRDIESRKSLFDKKIQQEEASRRAATDAEIELKEYEDELIRNRLADERKIAEEKQNALEGKFGSMVQKPIQAYQNWQEYGKQTRFEEYKTDFIRSKLLDPKYVQDYQTDTRFGGKAYFEKGDQTSQNYFIGLAEFIRGKLDAGDAVLASQFAPYKIKLDNEEARIANASAQAFAFALKNAIPVDMNSAQGAVNAPGGAQLQGGGAQLQGAGGGAGGGVVNPLTPNGVAPPANTTPPPPPPTTTPEEGNALIPTLITGTTGVALNEALRQTPVDVDNEFKKATPDQADSDKAIRSTYDQIEETQKQKEAIRGADEKLQGDNEKINRSKALAEKNIATAQSQINELEKEQASLKEKIQKKGTKYNKLEAKIKAYGKYSYTEQQEFKKQRIAIQDDMQKLLEEMVEKEETINAKKQGITRKQELLKELDKSSRSRRAIRNQEVGAIRKDPSMRSTNISNQRSTVNSDPDLKETAQRQAKLNALVKQKGMNPDDFRMSNGLLDETAMRDHIGKKKEFAITKLARRFPDLAKKIGQMARGRIGSNLLIATITGGTAYMLLSSKEKKEAEAQMKEVIDLEEIESELNATQSTQPNALQPAQ